MKSLRGKRVKTTRTYDDNVGVVQEHILENKVPVKWLAKTKSGFIITIEYVKDLKIVK